MALTLEQKRERRIERCFQKFKEISISKCFNDRNIGVAVLFQKLIRIGNSNEHGLCACVSCGVIKHYKEVHAGHFFGRANKSVVLDSRNCWPQCVRCNQFLNGNLAEYKKQLLVLIGQEAFDELEKKAKSKLQWTKHELAIEKVNILDEIKVHEQRLGIYA